MSERVWIASEILAQLAKISTRKSRKAMERSRKGETWRGHSLVTKQIHGQGGISGKSLLVALDSLPLQLQERFRALPADELQIGVHTFPDETQSSVGALDSKPPRAPSASANVKAEDLQRRFEHDVLSVALKHKKHTPERAAAIRSIAASEHRAPNGDLIRLSVQSIYRKLEKYESGGALRLGRATRNDKGRKHVIITRAFHAACPLSEAVKLDLSSAIDEYIHALWRSGMPGWRFVARAAASRLVELSKDAGWSAASLQNCAIPRRVVDRFKEARKASIFEKDAKQFYDTLDPSILRNVDGILPGEVVEGDVNVIDIPVRRRDGSIAYPRAIAWKCVATNRLHVDLIHPEKGEGVRREHVAMSFMNMCANFGLPKLLRLDNGSEYKWAEMLDGFGHLSRLAGRLKVKFEDNLSVHPRLNSVSRTRPNRPRGKSLEGDFGRFGYGALSVIPGHVGGDRMVSKSANLGKAPIPYPGTFEEFHRDYETAMQFHLTNAQRGKLGGLSPFERYQQFIDEGFEKTHVDEKTLMMAFASEESRIPNGGYVQWNGKTFYHDALLPFTGRRVRIRVMPLDPRYLFAFEGDRLICAAEPARSYGYTDPSGAAEQTRRGKLMRKHVAGIQKNVGRLDLVAEMRRDLAHRIQPPEAPIGTVISVTPHMQAMLDAVDAAEDAEDREQFLPSPAEPESMWLPRGARNKYLEALTYLPEDEETDDTTDEEL